MASPTAAVPAPQGEVPRPRPCLGGCNQVITSTAAHRVCDRCSARNASLSRRVAGGYAGLTVATPDDGDAGPAGGDW